MQLIIVIRITTTSVASWDIMGLREYNLSFIA